MILENLVDSMINGVFVGGGVAIGMWLVTRHFLKVIENLEEKIKIKIKNGKS